MPQFISILLIILPNILTYTQTVSNREYSAMLNKLLIHSVNEVSVNDVNIEEKIIFLDARENEEFKVSHIENAIWVGYNNFQVDSLKNVSADSKIIVYCSVGYRSEKIAEKLGKMGYQNVFNLYGGLFEWSNQGLPLVTGIQDQNTKNIHPYNKDWGKWISNGKKSYK